MSRPSPAEKQTEPAPFPPLGDYAFAAVLSWLIPGAGHWVLGYRVRATVLGATILGLFWTGEFVLADGLAVTRRASPVFFVGQVPNGLSTLIANKVWGEPRPDGDIDRDLPPHLNLGILCTLLSGLLNVLLILHVLDPESWREARRTGPPGEAEDAAAAAGGGIRGGGRAP